MSARLRRVVLTLKTITAALALGSSPAWALNTQYHVDSVNGDDSNVTPTEATPWQTIAKLNTITFEQGDQILFKRGCTWTGSFHLVGNGAPDAPLVVDAYGTGADPIINGGGAPYAIGVWNKQYLTIQNLEITNDSATAGNRDGIHLEYQTPGVYHGIKILNNNIHNVRARTDSSFNAQSNAAIYFLIVDGTAPGVQLDDVLIEGNIIHDLWTTGIFTKAPNYYGGNPQLWATNVVVDNNVIDKTGSDAIVLNGVSAPRIESNAAYDVGINSEGFAYFAGMWTGTVSKDALFQLNEVARVHRKSGSNFLCDAQAFDTDLGTIGTNIFQYNYTHDNAGGVLIMMWENVPKTVIYRYNLSVNDDRQTNSGSQFSINPIQGMNEAYIYNNVIYSTLPLGYKFLDKQASNFFNNIFYLTAATYPTLATFSNNCYFGHEANVNDPCRIMADPKFVGPLPTTTGGDGFGAMTTDIFKIHSDSPCINAGKSITTPVSNGGEDFWGNTLNPYAGGYADIGAQEVVGGSKAPPADPTVTDDAPSASVVYAGGGWTHTPPDSMYYASTKSYSSTVGNSVQYTFTGTNVGIFGRKGLGWGKMSVSVDGGAAALVDCYSPLDSYRKELFRASGLSGSGTHTLTITVATKNTYASANGIGIDYFQTLATDPGALPSVTAFDLPASGTFSGTWSYTPTDGTKFYGTTRAYSSTVGSSAGFSFTGTGVRLYGTKAWNYGKLSISIDGGTPSLVNCFQPGTDSTYAYAAKLCEINGLTAGTHTLVATVATKDPISGGNAVSLDFYEALVGGSGGSPVISGDYQFGTSTSTYASTDSDAGSTAGSIAFGAGITAGGISTTSGNPPNCLFIRAANNSTEAFAISGNKYITCTITPGSTLSFKAISFDYYRDSSASAANFSVRSSADGYATTIGSGTLTALTSWTAGAIDLSSVSALQNVSTAKTFRIYFWGGTDTSTPTRFDNIKVTTGP